MSTAEPAIAVEAIAPAVQREARHIRMDNAEYHAHPAIGASMLETFRASRRLYHGYYVTGDIPRPGPTAAMILGTLVHVRTLEPERFDSVVAKPYPDLAPDGKKWLRRKGSDHARWWEWVEFSRRGKYMVDADTLQQIEGIAAAILGNWHARRLLQRDGQPEFSIFWRDNETGLPLKCRVDWMADIPLDIKTTRDPAPGPFARDCVKLGYHRKAAHYRAGIDNYKGAPTPMVHLAAGTAAPYTVATYELDDSDRNRGGRSLGYQQWRDTLTQLAECYQTGDWREPYEREIVSLRMPGWAFTEDAYTIL